MSNYKLVPAILSLSLAKTWDSAVLEWTLKEVYEDSPQACLCGHSPIVEICVIKNIKNAAEAIVGNCCVKKFMGLPSDKIFQAIKRVRKENTRSLNIEAIEHAFQKKWISEWEKSFYIDIMKKRKLSDKQIAKKKEINHKLTSNIRKLP